MLKRIKAEYPLEGETLMKISIKNIGPLKDVELELGDITVLLGPPNSGKSYTLKSLYAQLVMLDEIARDYIIRDAIEEMEILEHINYFIRTVAPRTLIVVIAFQDYLQSENGERILTYLRDRVGVEKIDVELKGDEMIVSLQKSETIDLSSLANLLNGKLNSALQELMPWTDNTEIEIHEVSVPEISSLLHEMLRTPFEVDRSIDEKMGINSILRVSLRLENEETMKITAGMRVHLKLDSPMWDLLQRDLELRFKKLKSKSTGEEDVNLLLEGIFESRTRLIRPSSEWRIRIIFRDLSRLVSELIDYFVDSIGEQLKSTYEEAFNLQSAIFIPFGRSPFVYQLDTISNEPYLWHELIEIYKNNLPFYSYIYHLSKGRGQLLSDKANKGLVNIFNPVLQGELMFDRTTKRLRYKKWNTVDVPINYASALAGEVSGIMLPILSIPSNSYLIIEEPEAQLHYSAQILMGLVLAGLSRGFNHKIIFSTHSDVFAITLAHLKELDYDENAIGKLIRELLEVQGIEVDDEKVMLLAKAVSQAKDLDIRFYYYEPKPDGTVEVSEISAKDILREVPGITIITDILASWALSL